MWIFQNFAATPFVFLSAKYTRTTKPNDAVYVWLENVSSGGFEVCIREFSPFDGKHQDTVVVCIILPSEYHHRHHHLYDNNHHHYCHYYSYPFIFTSTSSHSCHCWSTLSPSTLPISFEHHHFRHHLDRRFHHFNVLFITLKRSFLFFNNKRIGHWSVTGSYYYEYEATVPLQWPQLWPVGSKTVKRCIESDNSLAPRPS